MLLSALQVVTSFLQFRAMFSGNQINYYLLFHANRQEKPVGIHRTILFKLHFNVFTAACMHTCTSTTSIQAIKAYDSDLVFSFYKLQI